ncbi:MAG: formate--tetrahydrofolate ligase [Thermoplasmata archaeon]|nr:formate--tetrahydrofolate ligase [Thermoplasmata archaeon]
MRSLEEVCADLRVGPGDVRTVGRGIGKLSVPMIRDRVDSGRKGKLVLITGMTPTSHGEGKTVTTIATAMALRRAGHTAVAVLRQPSLGPVFGVKGGATGGGKATVEPADQINLGFTGDLHAAAAAHNLLSALVNNHLYFGNELGLDPARIRWPWTVDMEDRALRQVVAKSGGVRRTVERDGRFVITAASEVTAVLGLARDYPDLKDRLGRIIVGVNGSGVPVRARDLHAEGAMAALLRDALEPNLVQCADGTPAIVHGGPFGNIAHGTASRLAIEFGLASAEYCVVEAGFATDLGAEKFVDIVCRQAGLAVDAGMLVTTVRGLRRQGGVEEALLSTPDPAAVGRGLENLRAHLANLRALGVSPVVVLNRFPDDSDAEVALVAALAAGEKAGFAQSTAFSDGASGASDVADRAVEAARSGGRSAPLYPSDCRVPEALDTLVRTLYGGAGADWSDEARRQLDDLVRAGEGTVPICVAKTALSLSDDPKKLGRPTGFRVSVRRVDRSSGAGFTVVFLGEIETMPGLPKRPRAEQMDVLPDGRIVGVG